MLSRAERLVERAERGQHRAHLDDRVDTEMRARAVGRAARHAHFAPHEPLVRDRDLQLGWLGDDRRVGVHRAQHLLDAEARVLLVGDGGDDEVAGEAQARRLARGEQGGRDAGLHVVGATTVEAVAVDARRVRIGHALDVDGVDVPAEQERAPAARAPCAHQHARTAGGLLEQIGFQPGLVGPCGDEAGDLRLPRAAGDERGVDRVDGDES